MKSKRLLQIFVMFVLLFSSVGGAQAAHASTMIPNDAMVINRDLSFWDATYFGFVSSSVYEKWHFEFTEAHDFTVTVSPLTGDLVPLLILLDANGNEITRDAGTLTSSQPAGTYYIQTQPESGSGIYSLTIRQVVNTQPSVSTTVDLTSMNVGDTALATVSLNNVPVEGYTSAEFTCTFDASLVAIGNITMGSLFGADPVAVINDSQTNSFIVAIAGSNGNRATTSGTVFTFEVIASQAGQTSIDCAARVSKGDNALTPLPSTGADVTITGSGPTATASETPVPVDSPTATSVTSDTPTATSVSGDTSTPTPTLVSGDTATATSVPVESPTATTNPAETPTPIFTDTPVVTDTPVLTDTPVASPTPVFTDTPLPTDTAIPSPTSLPAGTLSGQVIAIKPVTVSLYDVSDTLVASVPANTDGTFTLTAPAGTYTVKATAPGFLSAAGSATITSTGTTSLPTVTLIAGDIDGNNVIDQFDALTIGMSYNTDTPTEADLNNDGIINVLDLEVLARNYRVTGPTAW